MRVRLWVINEDELKLNPVMLILISESLKVVKPILLKKSQSYLKRLVIYGTKLDYCYLIT
jgi:hypothetical protein